MNRSVKLTGASDSVARKLEPARKTIPEDSVEEELERFRSAVEAVVERLSETAEQLRDSGSEEAAAIFEVHGEPAEDPELASGVEERVRDLQRSRRPRC